jgi:hypothetical protein
MGKRVINFAASYRTITDMVANNKAASTSVEQPINIPSVRPGLKAAD